MGSGVRAHPCGAVEGGGMMIHTDVQVTRTCSIEVYDFDNPLPENEALIKGYAHAVLPEGDWTYQELVWDSEHNAVVWYLEELE